MMPGPATYAPMILRVADVDVAAGSTATPAEGQHGDFAGHPSPPYPQCAIASDGRNIPLVSILRTTQLPDLREIGWRRSRS